MFQDGCHQEQSPIQQQVECLDWSISFTVAISPLARNNFATFSRLQLKCYGTRWRTGGEVKGKLAHGVGSQYTLHTTSEHGVSSITTADAHCSAASSRLNWRPRRFKLSRPFRWKTKSDFCACAITFQLTSKLAWMGDCWKKNSKLATEQQSHKWTTANRRETAVLIRYTVGLYLSYYGRLHSYLILDGTISSLLLSNNI